MDNVQKITSVKIANASVFAVMMVVGIHVVGEVDVGCAVWWLERFGHYGLFACAVPFFFLCSGYFLARHFEEKGWWLRECQKRLKTLLVPYVVWGTVLGVMGVVLTASANILHGRALFHGLHVTNLCIEVLGLVPTDWPKLVPLWYLRALILYVLISPFLLYFVRRLGWGWVIVAFSLSFWVDLQVLPSGMELFFTRFFSIWGLAWFSLGLCFRLKGGLVPKRGYYLGLLGAFMLVAFSAVFQRYRGYEVWRILQYGYVPLFMWGGWMMVPETAFPRWLTTSTFPIYLMHILLWVPFDAVIKTQCNTLVLWITKWIIGVSGPMIVALVLRRCFPRSANVLFGGR